MANSTPKNRQNRRNQAANPATINPQQYERLKAEAAAPYKVLRQFVYAACAASGFIGAVVFLAQLAAGRDVSTAIPNLGIQIGVVALMIGLFRLENKAK